MNSYRTCLCCHKKCTAKDNICTTCKPPKHKLKQYKKQLGIRGWKTINDLLPTKNNPYSFQEQARNAGYNTNEMQ
jgi:hypothetical protein